MRGAGARVMSCSVECGKDKMEFESTKCMRMTVNGYWDQKPVPFFYFHLSDISQVRCKSASFAVLVGFIWGAPTPQV